MLNQRDSVLNGVAWVLTERLASQGITFVLQIILARILMPEQYGMIAMINVFIAIANVFVIVGFSAALIQKKDADELDFSTLFYCSLAVGVVLYALIYLASPAIADFYNMPALSGITRIYALSLIISTYNSIQRSYVSRHMLFRKFFFATSIGTFLSGIIGISMAYTGFGVWALVAQYLSNIILNIVVLQFIVDWHPRLMFSWQRAKSLMKYGANICGATLIGTISLEIRQLLIGKCYTAADLSFFNRSRSIPYLIQTNVSGVINTVLFPAMSNHSDSPAVIKQMTRRSMAVTSYVMFFLMTMMAVAAQSIIILLLTEKWAPAIPYMRLVCVAYMIDIVSNANMQALKASGRADVLFKLEFIKKPAFLIFVLIAVKISVMAVAITLPLYSIYAGLINMSPNRKVLGYGIREQLHDNIKDGLTVQKMFLSIAMAVAIMPFLFFEMNEFVRFSLQAIVGTAVYVGGSLLFKVDSYHYVVSILKEKISKRNSIKDNGQNY